MPKTMSSIKKSVVKNVQKEAVEASNSNKQKSNADMIKISVVLRKAIKECGVNPTALGKFCGVAASTIRDFAAGVSSMSSSNMDRVCRVLGLELVQTGEIVADNIPRGRPSGEVKKAHDALGIPKYKDVKRGPVGRPRKVIEE